MRPIGKAADNLGSRFLPGEFTEVLFDVLDLERPLFEIVRVM